VLLSGSDIEYFFSDVLDAASGYNSQYQKDIVNALTPVQAPDGKVSCSFLSIWQLSEDSRSGACCANDKKKALLDAIQLRLQECVASTKTFDVYLESYESIEVFEGEERFFRVLFT